MATLVMEPAQGPRVGIAYIIEDLAEGDAFHPARQALTDHYAFQCGCCTPGQIMSAVALGRERVGGSAARKRRSRRR